VDKVIVCDYGLKEMIAEMVKELGAVGSLFEEARRENA